MSTENSGVNDNHIHPNSRLRLHTSTNTLFYDDIDDLLAKLRLELEKHLNTAPKGELDYRSLFFYATSSYHIET